MKDKNEIRILGLTLARGGSKTVLKKNIRPICGKPLISYTIKEAQKSKLLSRYIVSTDDHEIKKVAESFGAEAPFVRPAEYSSDSASSVFTGFEDYGHYWQKQENGSFEKIVSSMSSRESREPIFRALYGLGCATISSEIRKNSLTGNDIGIMPITDYRHTLNLREAGTREILENEFDER